MLQLKVSEQLWLLGVILIFTEIFYFHDSYPLINKVLFDYNVIW